MSLLWGIFTHVVFFLVGLLGGWFVSTRTYKRALLKANAMFREEHDSQVRIANQRLDELEQLASAYREVVAKSKVRR